MLAFKVKIGDTLRSLRYPLMFFGLFMASPDQLPEHTDKPSKSIMIRTFIMAGKTIWYLAATCGALIMAVDLYSRFTGHGL